MDGMGHSVNDILSGVPTQLFLGGTFRDASDGGTFEVRDPATDRVLVEVASATEDDARAALDAACDAQGGWAATSPRERSDILRRAFELILEHDDELTYLQSLEMGRALPDSRGEVKYAAEFFRWFSEEAVRLRGDYRRSPDGRSRLVTVRQPVGPALAITPWNFPLSMGTRKIGPALAAGCTVVLKPAAATPLTSLLLMEILVEAGVPAGVVGCVVTSDSRTLSSTLMADPRLRKVSFTGSTGVGRTLLGQASEHVLRSSMELGGNAPFLVLPSADIATAVEAAVPAKFRNNGEACTAANRFYVHSSVAKEFTAALVERTTELIVGPGIEQATTLGPLIDEAALQKVEELVDDAVQRGARVLTGGARLDRPGYFYQPTVLGDVPLDARVNSEEIFGPVAPIIVMDDVEEMIAAANRTEFGLMAYVAGQDLSEVTDTVQRIEAGMIAVNLGVASDPSAPFGGVKESGLGREGSHEGIAEYLETVYVRMPL